jgi:hypothetical protein
MHVDPKLYTKCPPLGLSKQNKKGVTKSIKYEIRATLDVTLKNFNVFQMKMTKYQLGYKFKKFE